MHPTDSSGCTSPLLPGPITSGASSTSGGPLSWSSSCWASVPACCSEYLSQACRGSSTKYGPHTGFSPWHFACKQGKGLALQYLRHLPPRLFVLQCQHEQSRPLLPRPAAVEAQKHPHLLTPNQRLHKWRPLGVPRLSCPSAMRCNTQACIRSLDRVCDPYEGAVSFSGQRWSQQSLSLLLLCTH